jgi:hypothetical protein
MRPRDGNLGIGGRVLLQLGHNEIGYEVMDWI